MEHLSIADIPRYCRTNKQFANFCRSSVGHAIIYRKSAGNILEYLGAAGDPLEYASTQRSNQETPIYLNKVVEMLRKNLDMLQKALNRYRDADKFGFVPQDSSAKEIIHYPETRFDPEINEVINLIMLAEGDLYPWIIIEVGMNNWSLYQDFDRAMELEFLVQHPELIRIMLRTWE